MRKCIAQEGTSRLPVLLQVRYPQGREVWMTYSALMGFCRMAWASSRYPRIHHGPVDVCFVGLTRMTEFVIESGTQSFYEEYLVHYRQCH